MAGAPPVLAGTSYAGARFEGPQDVLAIAAFNELDNLSLKEILDQDSRPTFVLDLDPDYIDSGDKHNFIKPIFCNAALRLHDRLLDSITGSASDGTPLDTAAYDEFRSWATGVNRFNDFKEVFPPMLLYQGLLWTGSTVRQRWRIVSGIKSDLLVSSYSSLNTPGSEFKVTPSKSDPVVTINAGVDLKRLHGSEPPPTVPSARSKNTSNITSTSGSSVTLTSPQDIVPDWTVDYPNGILPEHIQFARKVDWANSPLGPMKNWSLQFREVVNLLMRNPHPAALFWGEELTMIYNEAYKIEVAGNKHPDLMGTGFSGPFSELWDGVVGMFRECARTGNSIRRENDPLPIHRYGYLEETFFSWSFTPVYGGTDRILGFYNAPFETTYQTISARRMQMLRQLGESLAPARSVKQFWKRVLEGIEDNHYDVPFALLYSIVDSDDADAGSHSSDSTISLKSCLLEGSIGIPIGHPALLPKLDLKRSQEGFVPAFREAMRTREPTTLQTKDGTLPEALLEDIEWRGSGDPCNEAIIFPVRPTNGDTVFAFLLIGINPRRAYDDAYKDFAAMLNRQLATSLASVLLFEDEVRRSRNAAEAAAIQREMLTRQLEVQTSRMRRMTELSPLGMYLYNPEGVLVEANERYFEMTGHPKNSCEELAFLTVLTEKSQKTARDMWEKLLKKHEPQTAELELNNPNAQPRDLTGEPIEYWVLASSQAEFGENGELLSVMGSIADISHMVWVRGLQERRLKEAEETKRQQNEFIDITSHEMRNPLSAILICADDIRESLSSHKFTKTDAPVISDCLEAANNIALCVQHQKSIVDDILTVSKLDSNLLLITPVPAQPVAVVKRAMSMFKPEVQAKDLDFKFWPHLSLQELEVDWVLLDPSRLLQIIVNLITNAIKFTQTCDRREISVRVGASTEQPKVPNKDFRYVPTRSSLIDITAGNDWGTGQRLYLRVEVEDTGCGLTLEEKELLFERFTQASPRTHAHYGGSGLGLFISRQLAELHGGQIGVSSEAGLGSTFGFFLQCKRVVGPNRPILSRTPSTQSEKPDHAEASRALAVAVSGLTLDPIPVEESAKRISAQELHILIVEDNLVNQKVLSRQLQKAGCIVSTADNGLLALQHLDTTEFCDPKRGLPLSVILMDLEMPEMDGLTCVGRIREMQTDGSVRRHVPVIAVTANVRGEQIAAAKESGMDDVVSKPFRVPELLAKIDGLLKRLGER